jgi:hypothetical protein
MATIRPAFTASSVGRTAGTQFPELGSQYKGMAVKAITYWLAEKTQAQCRPHNVHDAVRTTCLVAITGFLRILDTAGFFLEEDEIREAERLGQLFLTSYQWLAVETDGRGENLWFIRPKHHYFLHIATQLRVTGFNPKKYSCEIDESYMNTMKKIGSKTHGLSVMRRMLERYLLALRVSLSRGRMPAHAHARRNTDATQAHICVHGCHARACVHVCKSLPCRRHLSRGGRRAEPRGGAGAYRREETRAPAGRVTGTRRSSSRC